MKQIKKQLKPHMPEPPQKTLIVRANLLTFNNKIKFIDFSYYLNNNEMATISKKITSFYIQCMRIA